jgi:hypothetical protein
MPLVVKKAFRLSAFSFREDLLFNRLLKADC